MSFLKRFIDVEITLKEGFFSDTSDTITLKGHRVNCIIRNPGGYNSGEMQCVIYGLSQKYMNQLTAIGVIQTQNIGNQITITAGSIDANGKKDSGIAFKGWIQMAWADYNQQPNSVLNIIAMGGYPFYLRPVQPTSFEGDVDINTIMSALAKEQGYKLDNQGVSGFLSDITLNGNTIEKIQAAADAGKFNYKIDDISNTVIIYPFNGVIFSGFIPVVNSKNGMIGYPTFNSSGIIVESIYNLNISNGLKVQIESDILSGITATVNNKTSSANGVYGAFDVLHTIESENNQGGAWFTSFRGFRIP